MLSPHWVEGPYPDCADCPRVGSYYYLDARTGRWRYGCDRHFRQRRTDSHRVAYVLTRGTALRGARERAANATDGPRAWSAADAPS